jgi:transcriptional regulator with XRE-family HTH domain
MKYKEYELASLNSLAKNIKKARVSVGISQEKLAELCEIDRTYVSLLERSKRNPSFFSLLKICKGLNVPLSELMIGVR